MAESKAVGKKRIVTQTQEELLKEEEKIENRIRRVPQSKIGAEYTSRAIKSGRIYVSSSYNNTLMTLTDPQGNTLAWVSAGNVGFKGTKKATPFAASKVAEAMTQIARKFGIDSVAVFVKGVGSGRDSAIRALASRGLDITLLKDITPIPHNGCRPPKVRRV